MSPDYEQQRAHYRDLADKWLTENGWKPHELQALWRSPACFERQYSQTEVGYAVIDALVHEGCTAWWGDGTSCVEQMIRLQAQRADRAESKVSRLQDSVARLELEAHDLRERLKRDR